MFLLGRQGSLDSGTGANGQDAESRILSEDQESSEHPLRPMRARMNTLPPAPSSSRLHRHRMTLADWNDL